MGQAYKGGSFLIAVTSQAAGGKERKDAERGGNSDLVELCTLSTFRPARLGRTAGENSRKRGKKKSCRHTTAAMCFCLQVSLRLIPSSTAPRKKEGREKKSAKRKG